MTFQYDECADVLWVALAEPRALCVYVESQTPGVILRVEEVTGAIRGFQILAWSRRIAVGPVLIPEIIDDDFQEQWTRRMAVGS
jgi:hypothetical protein